MNRQPYNRSGFNRTAHASQSASGISLMKMSAAAAANRDIKTLPAQASLSLIGAANATNIKYGGGRIIIIMAGSNNAVLVHNMDVGASSMVMSGAADSTVQGEAVINLVGLVLAPGDELIINTVDQTVTLNSQNGMRYFSLDSEFFNLLSGVNKIVYSDASGSRNVLIDILWKDRWL